MSSQRATSFTHNMTMCVLYSREGDRFLAGIYWERAAEDRRLMRPGTTKTRAADALDAMFRFLAYGDTCAPESEV
jgi:hypothetical protein